jgi:hypothetical protein
MFDERVLPITDIMLKWRLLIEEGRKTGHTFSQPTSSSPRLLFSTGFRSSRVNEAIMTKRVCQSSISGRYPDRGLRAALDLPNGCGESDLG